MMFCQPAQAKPLREICDGLRCCLGKLNHPGLKDAPRRSTVSYASAHRPWQLYQRTFYSLLGTCRSAAPGKKRKFRFKNRLLSLDASVIDLCIGLFPWAEYRQTKGAVKLHLLLDHDGYLPAYVYITEGKVHEVTVARLLKLPPGSIVAMDRGYNDYTLYREWTEAGVWFVTRLKRNAVYEVLKEQPIPRNRNIVADHLIRFTGPSSSKECPLLLRRIVARDPVREEESRIADQPPEVRRRHHRGHLQGSLADRDIFQDAEAKPQDQNVRGDHSERAANSDLDSIDCDPADQVPHVQIQIPVGVLESGGDAALESVHLPEPLGVDRRSLPESAASPARATQCH